MKEITYQDHKVTMTYEVYNDLLQLNSLRENKEAVHNNFLVGYACTDEEGTKKLIDAIIEAKADLYVIFSDEFGENFSLHFTADELKANRIDMEEDHDKYLKICADNAKLQTPQEIDEGLTMVDVTLDSQYFIYIYSCDEQIYDIDMLTENYDELKKILINDLDFSNPVIVKLCNKLKETNRGLAYKYIGNTSGKVLTVHIAPDEL